MTALPIIMAVTTAVGAISQANAASATAKSQQQAADYNATIQRQQATLTRQQGAVAEDAHRRRVRSILGQQRAALAESGMGFTGTGGLLLNQSAAAAELDALNMRYETDLKARGLLSDANMTQFEGETAGAAGKAAMTSGYLSAGTALATGAASYGGFSSTKSVVPAGAKAAKSPIGQPVLRYRY
jgi:hypothetical protein